MRILLIAIIVAVLPQAHAETKQSGKLISGETNFATLINSSARGKATRTPWVGYWWPYANDGIASPIHDPTGTSPADKYDAAYRAYLISKGTDVSNYQSAAVWEMQNHGAGGPDFQAWQGHDVGWAAASILFAEPTKPVNIMGTAFAVHDLKALLAELALDPVADTYGLPVITPGDHSSPRHNDVAPNQFFLALTNYMGRDGKAIVIDRNTGVESWNVPLVGYAIDYPKPQDFLGLHPRYRNVYRIAVTARVWWANGNLPADTVTPAFNMDALYDVFNDNSFPGRKYTFEVWLDAPVAFNAAGMITSSGNVTQLVFGTQVVGGEWPVALDPENASIAHPDVLWVPRQARSTTDKRNPSLDYNWILEHLSLRLNRKPLR